MLVILSAPPLRGEEPAPSEAEGIWAIRAKRRAVCDARFAFSVRFHFTPGTLSSSLIRESQLVEVDAVRILLRIAIHLIIDGHSVPV